jgi:hypothetical protein
VVALPHSVAGLSARGLAAHHAATGRSPFCLRLTPIRLAPWATGWRRFSGCRWAVRHGMRSFAGLTGVAACSAPEGDGGSGWNLTPRSGAASPIRCVPTACAVGYNLSPFGLTAAGVSVHTACAVGYDLSPFGLTAAGVSVPTACAVGYDLSPFGLTIAGVSVHTACAVGYDLSAFGLTAAGVSVHTACAVGYDLSPFGLTAAGVSVPTACAVGYDLSPFGLTAAGVSVLPRAGCPSHLITIESAETSRAHNRHRR